MNVKALIIASLMVVVVLFIPAADAESEYDVSDGVVEIKDGLTKLSSYCENVRVEAGVNATLDLNGNTINTLYNYGNLKIIDSIGVQNETAITYLYNFGTVEINNGSGNVSIDNIRGFISTSFNTGNLTVTNGAIAMLLNSGSTTINGGIIGITICIELDRVKYTKFEFLEEEDTDDISWIINLIFNLLFDYVDEDKLGQVDVEINMLKGNSYGIFAIGDADINISGGNMNTILDITPVEPDDMPPIGFIPLSNIIAAGTVNVNVTGAYFNNTLSIVSSLDEQLDALFEAIPIDDIPTSSEDIVIAMPSSPEEAKEMLQDLLNEFIPGVTLDNHGTVSLKNYYENGKYISGEPEQNWGGSDEDDEFIPPIYGNNSGNGGDDVTYVACAAAAAVVAVLAMLIAAMSKGKI